MSTLRWLLLLLAAALALGLGRFALRSAAPAPPYRPDIVVIVVDSLRADAIAAAAPEAAPMPALSRLAARSVVYDRAYAPSSWTLPSVASLLTARYPSQHQARWWGYPIATMPATLASVLRANGYVTAGFSAHTAVGPEHNLDQGFDDFVVVKDPRPFVKVDAAALNDAVWQWLDARRGTTAPYFFYLHYMDVHLPYRPHPGVTPPRRPDTGLTDAQLSQNVTQGPWVDDAKRAELWHFSPAEQTRLRQLYDGEARYVDGRLAELLAGLQQRTGRAPLVVLTADHGEEFGEHDVYGHAVTLYEAAIHVPLVIALPDGPARRVAEPVSVGGLGPALLARLDIPVPAEMRIPGFDIDGAGRPAAPPFAYAELLDTEFLTLRAHERAIVGQSAKLLETPAGETALYVEDPAERAPRHDAHWQEVLETAMRAARSAVVVGGAAPQVELDAGTQERLRNLGYGGGD